MGVPFVHPAPEVSGVFITGRFVRDFSYYPPKLPDGVDFSGYGYDDLDTEQKIEAIMTEGANVHSATQLKELSKRIEASLKMVDSERWDLVVLVDNLPDEVFHFSYDDKVVIDKMFILLDNWLGELLRRMKKEDTLLIVSDHGFRRVDKILFINEWLAANQYLDIQRSGLSRVTGRAGINWDMLAKSGMASSLYVFLLNHAPQTLALMKRVLGPGLVLDQGANQANRRVSAFNINEPVAWLRISGKDAGEFTSTHTRLMADLAELKKSGLLKSYLLTKDLYNGKRVDQAPGQLIVEAPDGWAIDTTRLNNGKYVGNPLLTKKGIHALDGILICYGEEGLRGTNLANRTLSVYDIVPTVLNLLKLPIPSYIDGVALWSVRGHLKGDWTLDVPERL